MTDTNTHPAQLPDTWIQTTVGTIYSVIGGGTPSTDRPEYWNGDIPWITSADIHGLNDIRPRKSITQAGVENSATNLVPAGSLIVVTRVSLGKLALTETPLCFSQDSQALIDTSNEINSKYALYFLSKAVEIFKYRNRGTTISGVTKKELRDLEFLLPPLPEQHRIVDKIEELFSDLDASVAALLQAQAHLRIYRQAVLKYAFDGRLTERWRAQHAPPPAGELLAQIQAERAQRHQRQLADWKVDVQRWEAAGRTGRKPARPRQPEELAPLSAGELEELGELPEGWVWAKVGEAFEVYVGATPSRKVPGYWNGTISWVSSGEVAFCEIHQTRETITESGRANTSTEVHPIGTVLLAMIGEGRTRGQAAILKTRAAHNQNTAAIRVSQAGCPPQFLYCYFLFNYEETRRIGSGNNQQALNKSRVCDIVIPFPPLAEQLAIVAEVEARLSVVDKLEETLAAALRQAEALRQSILRRAFAGKLVAQDPNDEPAQQLLERIKKARPA